MNLKKMLAIMLLSLIPLTALAEGDEPTEDPAYTDPTEPKEPSTDPVDVGDPAEDPAEDPAQAGEELDNPRNLEGDEGGEGGDPYWEPIVVTGVTVDPTSATLTVGETLQLLATIEPENADDQSIRWSSEDGSIATVDQNGFVTAIAEGGASIKASSDSGHYGECLITVIAAEPTTPEVPQEPEPVERYYLAGSFNAWAVQDAYQLTQNPADANEYMRLNVYLEAGVEVKLAVVHEEPDRGGGEALGVGVEHVRAVQRVVGRPGALRDRAAVVGDDEAVQPIRGFDLAFAGVDPAEDGSGRHALGFGRGPVKRGGGGGARACERQEGENAVFHCFLAFMWSCWLRPGCLLVYHSLRPWAPVFSKSLFSPRRSAILFSAAGNRLGGDNGQTERRRRKRNDEIRVPDLRLCA